MNFFRWALSDNEIKTGIKKYLLSCIFSALSRGLGGREPLWLNEIIVMARSPWIHHVNFVSSSTNTNYRGEFYFARFLIPRPSHRVSIVLKFIKTTINIAFEKKKRASGSVTSESIRPDTFFREFQSSVLASIEITWKFYRTRVFYRFKYYLKVSACFDHNDVGM